MEYNFIDGYVFDVSNQNHAEVTDFSAAGERTKYYWLFNTILRGKNVGGGSGTSNIWLSAATNNGSIFTDSQVRNNVIVDNCNPRFGGRPCVGGSGFITQGASLVSIQSKYFTDTSVTENFVDNSGAFYFGIANGATCTNPVKWSGNIELRSGNEVSKERGLCNCGSLPRLLAIGPPRR